MSRRDFPDKVKAQAFLRANGQCEGKKCGARLTVGKFAYDHDLADNLGGEPTLENCKVLCLVCHKHKTKTQDMPKITKGRRLRKGQMGIKKPRTIRAWRRFSGELVIAPRER